MEYAHIRLLGKRQLYTGFTIGEGNKDAPVL